MFVLEIESKNTERIKLTQNESNYQITNIDGLNPPKAQINMSNVAGMDGAAYNSSKLETRNIVITVKINGNVEANRLSLYRYFRTKEWCKIFYSNGSRKVYIEGYVENLEAPLFTKSEIAQISIICPNPYFKDIETIVDDISKIIKRFTFPFNINLNEPVAISDIELQKITTISNSSESESGLIINTTFFGNVNKFEIKNVGTGEDMVINYPFVESDILYINCNRGSKKLVLIRNAVEYNLIPYLKKGSTFFQLSTGDNNFSYLADDGVSDQLVSIQFEHYNVYRGV